LHRGGVKPCLTRQGPTPGPHRRSSTAFVLDGPPAARPLTTFRRVTLPLSRNGVFSGSALVFILSLGAYVIPRLLGSTQERTLPVLIELQIIQETNYPFGAVMSIVLVAVVVGSLAILLRFTNLTAAGLGGGESR